MGMYQSVRRPELPPYRGSTVPLKKLTETYSTDPAQFVHTAMTPQLATAMTPQLVTAIVNYGPCIIQHSSFSEGFAPPDEIMVMLLGIILE